MENNEIEQPSDKFFVSIIFGFLLVIVVLLVIAF